MKLSNWVDEEKNRLNTFFTWYEDLFKRDDTPNISMNESPLLWHDEYRIWKERTYLEEDRHIEEREIGIPDDGLYGRSYQNRNVGETK